MGNINKLILVIGVNAFFIGNIYALDLKPVEASPVRVGACDQQVRLRVALEDTANRYVGKPFSASYRIAVYSTRNNRLITTFSASDQKIGEIFTFVVPSSVLACESGLRIVLDDKNQVEGEKRDNNTIRVRWQPPGREFGSPCIDQLDKCR